MRYRLREIAIRNKEADSAIRQWEKIKELDAEYEEARRRLEELKRLKRLAFTVAVVSTAFWRTTGKEKGERGRESNGTGTVVSLCR